MGYLVYTDKKVWESAQRTNVILCALKSRSACLERVSHHSVRLFRNEKNNSQSLLTYLDNEWASFPICSMRESLG